jgi:hypothetical protein
MLEIYKSVRVPQVVTQFLAGYDFARVLDEYHQNLKRLFRKPGGRAVLVQFSGAHVQLERPQAYRFGGQ